MDSELVLEEFHCVGNSCALGFGEVAGIISVMFQCWPNIESFAGVFSPCPAFTGSIMDGNFSCRGSQGCSIIVKVTVDHSIGR